MSTVGEDEDQLEKFETLCNNAFSLPCGYSIEYRGLTLEKVDWPHPDHGEYQVKDQDGKVVESYTITASDSPEELKRRLDQLISQKQLTINEAVEG